MVQTLSSPLSLVFALVLLCCVPVGRAMVCSKQYVPAELSGGMLLPLHVNCNTAALLLQPCLSSAISFLEFMYHFFAGAKGACLELAIHALPSICRILTNQCG